MITLTRSQREALLRIYRRIVNETRSMAFTYRAFRKSVQPGPDCIMVPFAGMWLGIEKDGYTHS